MVADTVFRYFKDDLNLVKAHFSKNLSLVLNTFNEDVLLGRLRIK